MHEIRDGSEDNSWREKTYVIIISSRVPDADPERDYYANAELSPIMLKENLIPLDEYEKMKEKESGGKKFKAKRMIKKLKRKGQ